MIVVWLLAMTWTVVYCWLFGYNAGTPATPRTADNLTTFAGFPDWIVYGVIAPWVACSVITVLYGLFGMDDDDLGHEGGETGELA